MSKIPSEIRIKKQAINDPIVSLPTRPILVERIVFNFSFVTSKKGYGLDNLDGKTLKKLFEVMQKLSSEKLTIVKTWPRQDGIEVIDKLKYSVISSEFDNSERSKKCLDGYRVFRISKLGRVIGKMYENTFYILAIDTRFNLYDH